MGKTKDKKQKISKALEAVCEVSREEEKRIYCGNDLWNR